MDTLIVLGFVASFMALICLLLADWIMVLIWITVSCVCYTASI